MRFAKWVFLMAGIYGLAALLPQYFVKPSADRPEIFYGFVGVAIAWQLLFVLTSVDVARFRPIMPVAVVEKLGFGIPAVVLFTQGRIAPRMLAAGIIDLVLAVLFLVAWSKTRPTS
jgi:hypothetical protein